MTQCAGAVDVILSEEMVELGASTVSGSGPAGEAAGRARVKDRKGRRVRRVAKSIVDVCATIMLGAKLVVDQNAKLIMSLQMFCSNPR